MSKNRPPTSLDELLDRIEAAAEDVEQVTLGAILEEVGRRSFGPLLLVAGLIAVAPVVGDFPGVPTSVGVVVFSIAIQLLFAREYFWLPQWLLKRSVASDKVHKSLSWLRRPARFVDRLLRPRLTVLTKGAASYVIAVVCILIAASMPAMEVVPFAANLAGAALAAFGLAMIAQDGVLSLIAFGFTAITAGMIVYSLL